MEKSIELPGWLDDLCNRFRYNEEELGLNDGPEATETEMGEWLGPLAETIDIDEQLELGEIYSDVLGG